jgi:hypothetical protein
MGRMSFTDTMFISSLMKNQSSVSKVIIVADSRWENNITVRVLTE